MIVKLKNFKFKPPLTTEINKTTGLNCTLTKHKMINPVYKIEFHETLSILF